jgi:membrane fusion protein, multidrug efflux system
MSTITKRIVSFLALLLIVGIAFYPKLKGVFSKKEEDKKENSGGKDPKKGGKTAVSVVVIQSSLLKDGIQCTGSLIPNEEVEVRSEVSGRLVELNIAEGASVAKGAVLFKINDEDLQARLKKLGFSKKLAEDNEFRQKKLLEKEAISQREYDIAVANVNTLSADIEEVKAQLAKTIVKAPFDGTIGLRYVSSGAYISPTTRIATLTNINPIKLEFSVPAKYASQIRKGSRVEFTTEGSERTFGAVVYAIDPKIDPQTRTLQLRATAPNPNRALIPGSFAKINVVLATKGTAIQIPTEAVIPEANGQKVFVVKNGKAMPQKVKLGLRTEQNVEVLDGISAGDTLITIGIMQVKPEGEVEVKEVIKQQ